MVVVEETETQTKCNKCLSKNVTKSGFGNYSGRFKQRLYCKNCNRYFFTLLEEKELEK